MLWGGEGHTFSTCPQSVHNLWFQWLETFILLPLVPREPF